MEKREKQIVRLCPFYLKECRMFGHYSCLSCFGKFQIKVEYAELTDLKLLEGKKAVIIKKNQQEERIVCRVLKTTSQYLIGASTLGKFKIPLSQISKIFLIKSEIQ